MSDRRYTMLCLSCLRTQHGSDCTCGGQRINVGDRSLARLISQNQGDRHAILQLYDGWNYQSSYLKNQRFLIWLHGFPVAKEVRILHPQRWDKLLRDGKGAIEQRFVSADPDNTFSWNTKIEQDFWLIENGWRHPVEIRN